MNSDGSGQTRLTNSLASDVDPARSPDGAKIAFATDRDGNFEIYVMDANGANHTRVTFNPTADTSPAWQPVTPTSGPTVQFNVTSYGASEMTGVATITVNRLGETSGSASVDYATSDGSASERSDYLAAVGTLSFAPGETSKTINVFVVNDAFGESAEAFNVTLSNPVGLGLGSPTVTTVTIDSDESVNGLNPVKDASFNTDFYVRQQYLDFLGRAPDAGGLAFWKNQIDECETRPPAEQQSCREVRRINVSAAFFLSIEFQETGYLAYRFYKAAYGDASSPNVVVPVPIIRLREFLADAQRMGQGVQVGIGDWQTQLENNKSAFAREFVVRQRFLSDYSLSLTPAQFVDQLNQRAGGVLSESERNQLIAELTAATDVTQGRASVIRKVAEDADLRQRELNRAFVLMQYYGYLRRNPDDPNDTDFRGWEFWLNKLNQHNGNFVNAEMVKAFIVSGEYQQRFGP